MESATAKRIPLLITHFAKMGNDDSLRRQSYPEGQ
jgi:hypothetical protein